MTKRIKTLSHEIKYCKFNYFQSLTKVYVLAIILYFINTIRVNSPIKTETHSVTYSSVKILGRR